MPDRGDMVDIPSVPRNGHETDAQPGRITGKPHREDGPQGPASENPLPKRPR